MKLITFTKRFLIVALALMSFNSFAQSESKVSFDLGADYVSRYIWRGLTFSDSPAIQPYMELAAGNFAVGIWGSYETGGEVVGQEFDFYASYGLGPISIMFTDYSFPTDAFSDDYFNDGHTGEIGLGYDGPVSISAFMNIYGDDDNSFYAELGVPFSIQTVDLNLFLGGGNGAYTSIALNEDNIGDFGITNMGLGASKEIKITDNFSLSPSVNAIFNPNSGDAYLVFGISL